MLLTDDHYTQEGAIGSLNFVFLPGESQRLLLIKTGLGGSIQGYNGKYLRIAQHFNSAGYSVLCCASPQDMDDRTSFDTAIEVTKTMLGTHFSGLSIDYMGVSRGAYQGILYGNTIEQIKSLLLINPPMTVNFSKQVAGLRNLDKPSVLVIGTRDASYKFWPWLTSIDNPYLKMIEVVGADHHFKEMDQEFFNLPVEMILSGCR